MRAYVIVIPGNRSLPRCVRGIECPPRHAIRDRSNSNWSISQSTSGPLLAQSTLATSGRLAPPFKVSFVKISTVSLIPFSFWVFVSAPFIPLVAFVEFPPQNDDLSRRTTLAPHSRRVLPADPPAKPPPTTMPCEQGNTQAPQAIATLPERVLRPCEK